MVPMCQGLDSNRMRLFARCGLHTSSQQAKIINGRWHEVRRTETVPLASFIDDQCIAIENRSTLQYIVLTNLSEEYL